jgi:hypothetical protein
MPLTADALKWQPFAGSPAAGSPGPALLEGQDLGLDMAKEEVGVEVLVRNHEIGSRVDRRTRNECDAA